MAGDGPGSTGRLGATRRRGSGRPKLDKVFFAEPIGPDLGAAHGKWRAAARAGDGVIYCPPWNASRVLRIDSTKGPPVEVDEVGPDLGPSGRKYRSAFAGRDGCIYCIPWCAGRVLRIEPEAGTAALVGPDFGPDPDKWRFCTLCADGAVYAVPWHAARVLRVDTLTSAVELIGPDCGRGRGLWRTGVSGLDGKLYCPPSGAARVLRLDPSGGGQVDLFGPDLGAGGDKWRAVVRAENGDVYAAPWGGARVLRIEPDAGRVTPVGPDLSGEGEEKWKAIAVARDGSAYCPPFCASKVLRIGLDGGGEAGVEFVGGDLCYGGHKWCGAVRGLSTKSGYGVDVPYTEAAYDPVAANLFFRQRPLETATRLAQLMQLSGGFVSNTLADNILNRSDSVVQERSQQLLEEVNTDLVGLVDAWGAGFIEELDYRKEAAATTAFSEAMRQRGLGSVIAPEVVPSLSSAHVLTTKWVDGERLAASGADDVPRLCGVALNAYLTMLLDTGKLHCDPHPGNLLRTRDGRLCILDFGMCLEVPRDLQLSLLEFIADLQAQNYERVPEDLVKLGFVPEDKLDELRSSGLTYGITQMLEIATTGGGPKGAMERLVAKNKAKYRAADGSELSTQERQRRFREDWQREMAKDALKRSGSGTSTTSDLTQKIEQMQQDNSDVFAIPDYFVYMARAFATLEGIGLSVNPNYAILSECFPYLAKRLLSDDSPRARGALRTLLYGTGDELNLAKLQEVTAGLEKYTSSTSSVESSRGMSDEGRNAAAAQLAAVVLSEEGNYPASLLLREAAVALDATLRDAVASRIAPLRSLAFPLPAPPRELASLIAPATLPFELLQATLELQDLDARDTKRLQNVRILADLASRAGGSSSAGAGAARGGDVLSLAREAAARSTALARVGIRFGGVLADTQAERLRRRSGNEGGQQSRLAGRLAAAGAEALERVASAIASIDRGIAARSEAEKSARGRATGAPSNSGSLRGSQNV
ncbi:unnamed protein product [Prorocentrum cordatum]|uniref:ABC1 atypical kinase-like domain-containing protein n=1 Tax=Prorocentrum cordatum TaxID=2364126 RepID=A0ABN9PX94_9DINO|nr:unnamed protein product [Polarella glacialis]